MPSPCWWRFVFCNSRSPILRVPETHRSPPSSVILRCGTLHGEPPRVATIWNQPSIPSPDSVDSVYSIENPEVGSPMDIHGWCSNSMWAFLQVRWIEGSTVLKLLRVKPQDNLKKLERYSYPSFLVGFYKTLYLGIAAKQSQRLYIIMKPSYSARYACLKQKPLEGQHNR